MIMTLDAISYKPTGKYSCLIRVLEPEYKEDDIPYHVNHLNDFSFVMELYSMTFEKIYHQKNDSSYSMKIWPEILWN